MIANSYALSGLILVNGSCLAWHGWESGRSLVVLQTLYAGEALAEAIGDHLLLQLLVVICRI